MKAITFTRPLQLISILSFVALIITTLSSLIINGFPFPQEKTLYEINLPGLASFNFSSYHDAWVLSIPWGIFLSCTIALYLYRFGRKFIVEKFLFNIANLFISIGDEDQHIPMFVMMCIVIVAQVIFFPNIFWSLPLFIALICFINKTLINNLKANNKFLFYIFSNLILLSLAYAFIYSSIEFSFLMSGILIFGFSLLACVFFILLIIIYIIVSIFTSLFLEFITYIANLTIKIISSLKQLPNKLGIKIQ